MKTALYDSKERLLGMAIDVRKQLLDKVRFRHLPGYFDINTGNKKGNLELRSKDLSMEGW